MEIQKVGVVGCGLMGSGIAHTTSRAGFSTIVVDINQQLLDRGLERIYKFIDRGIEKGKTTLEEKDTVSRNLGNTIDLKNLSGCNIIIEAIPENKQLKIELFKTLDEIVSKGTIFTSNTSSIRITDLAKNTKRIDRFLGTHFFNPVPIMNLVEVIKIERTSENAFNSAMNFIRALDKVPIVCKDSTGFVVNRLLTPYLLDGVRAFEKNIASITDIDNAMVLGCGYPMGPLTLIDFVGVETVHHISGIMSSEFEESQYESPMLLTKMIEKGWFGKKSGKGFYDYSKVGPEPNDLELRDLLNE